MEYHQLLPDYNRLNSPLNRPQTAKSKASHLRGGNPKAEIIDYKAIARKCESANKNKKRGGTNLSNIRPWDENEGIDGPRHAFDVSLSSINDSFYVGF